MIVARPTPVGPYRWRFPAGTRGVVDMRVGNRYRLRLVPGLNAWVLGEDLRVLPPGTPAPASAVGDLGFETRGDRTSLGIPLAFALPIELSQPDPRTVELTLFGATGRTNRVAFGPAPRFVESAEWEQLPGPAWRLRMHLAAPLWGWKASYGVRPESGPAELRLDLRRPPGIDPGHPLRGRRIAVDPGHPGAGATGPTGYYEGDANLAIARILVRLLAERGAEPVLIRTDTLPMGLYERTTAAEEAGAELFVSIHNNALPDGVRPFGREGTSTYWFHPLSAPLAAAVQEGMLREMRLRDLGVFWGDLAVCRMSWMPAVLTEGAFMMMPRQEAALRTPEFQGRYARGVLEGIEEFLSSVAGAGR
jgi:N-acetylmuramoyl-L-alanine amidase